MKCVILYGWLVMISVQWLLVDECVMGAVGEPSDVDMVDECEMEAVGEQSDVDMVDECVMDAVGEQSDVDMVDECAMGAVGGQSDVDMVDECVMGAVGEQSVLQMYFDMRDIFWMACGDDKCPMASEAVGEPPDTDMVNEFPMTYKAVEEQLDDDIDYSIPESDGILYISRVNNEKDLAISSSEKKNAYPTVTWLSFDTLTKNKELFVTIINAYIKGHLNKYDRFVYGVLNYVNWKELINNNIKTFKECEGQGRVFILCNERNHWTLAVVIPKSLHLYYLDPRRISTGEYLQTLFNNRTGKWWNLTTVEFEEQQDDTSCGVIVCQFVKEITMSTSTGVPDRLDYVETSSNAIDDFRLEIQRYFLSKHKVVFDVLMKIDSGNNNISFENTSFIHLYRDEQRIEHHNISKLIQGIQEAMGAVCVDDIGHDWFLWVAIHDREVKTWEQEFQNYLTNSIGNLWHNVQQDAYSPSIWQYYMVCPMQPGEPLNLCIDLSSEHILGCKRCRKISSLDEKSQRMIGQLLTFLHIFSQRLSRKYRTFNF